MLHSKDAEHKSLFWALGKRGEEGGEAENPSSQWSPPRISAKEKKRLGLSGEEEVERRGTEKDGPFTSE